MIVHLALTPGHSRVIGITAGLLISAAVMVLAVVGMRAGESRRVWWFAVAIAAAVSALLRIFQLVA